MRRTPCERGKLIVQVRGDTQKSVVQGDGEHTRVTHRGDFAPFNGFTFKLSRALMLSTSRGMALCRCFIPTMVVGRPPRADAPWNLAGVSIQCKLDNRNPFCLDCTHDHSQPGIGVDVYAVGTFFPTPISASDVVTCFSNHRNTKRRHSGSEKVSLPPVTSHGADRQRTKCALR